MYLIEVSPISHGTALGGLLTYFSTISILPGSIVSIEIRKRVAHAVVISSESAERSKALIRKNDFALKKIRQVVAPSFISPAILSALLACARNQSVAPGALLSVLLPKRIIERPETFLAASSVVELPKKKTPAVKPFFIRGEPANAAREVQSRHPATSILIIVPTKEAMKKVAEGLAKDKQPIYTCDSSISPKEHLSRFRQITEEPSPVVIITTPGYFLSPRTDIGAILLVEEGSPFYKTEKRPPVDLKDFFVKLGQITGVSTYLADIYPSIEIEWAIENQQTEEVSIKKEGDSLISPTIVPMQPKEEEKKEYRILSKELLTTTRDTIEQKKNVFIFTLRTGLATTVSCQDCGRYVACGSCERPVILTKSPSGNMFACRSCGAKRNATESCKECGSWNLKGLGVGTETVVEALRKEFPHTPLFLLEKSHAKKQTVDDFYAANGAILVGTEFALSRLHAPISCVGVSSFESLFSLPDLGVQQKIFRIMYALRRLATDHIVIQTRQSEPLVRKIIAHNGWKKLYEEEMAVRQTLGYPPFFKLIKCSAVLPHTMMEKETAWLKQTFAEWAPVIYGGKKTVRYGQIRCLFKIKNENWPNDELLQKLALLPPYWEIDTTPSYLA